MSKLILPMAKKNAAQQILELTPQMMRFMRSQMSLMSEGSLSVPQFRVLVKVAKEPSTHQEVADWMGITAPTLTRMIDSLVEKKLVARTRDSADGRKTILEATPAGRNLFLKYRQKAHQTLEAKIDGLTSAEKRKLNEGLDLLTQMFISAHV